MRQIKPLGRKFFWVKFTGNIVTQRHEMAEGVESTKEEDFAVYVELKQYDPETIEMTTFEPGQYAEEFMQAKSWRFDPTTGDILFSYPDPTDSEPQEPVYQKPLSVEVAELRQADAENKQAIADLTMTLAAVMSGGGAQ